LEKISAWRDSSHNLARHVELEFPRRVRKIEQRAPRRFHRLHFPSGDPVQPPLEEVFLEGHHVVRQQPLIDPRLAMRSIGTRM
jgi:hypothetical protein